MQIFSAFKLEKTMQL